MSLRPYSAVERQNSLRGLHVLEKLLNIDVGVRQQLTSGCARPVPRVSVCFTLGRTTENKSCESAAGSAPLIEIIIPACCSVCEYPSGIIPKPFLRGSEYFCCD